MHGHSALPNMLTRSRSAATSCSSVPLAAKGSMPRQWQRPSQAPGKLMPHWCMRRPVLIDELVGVGGPQELTHLDGSRLALPAEPRSCEPPCGRRKRASRDPTEQGRQRRMELVGVNPPRHAEHVRDVFPSSASEAWCCESGVVEAGKGPIPVFTRGEVPALGRRRPVLSGWRWREALWLK